VVADRAAGEDATLPEPQRATELLDQLAGELAVRGLTARLTAPAGRVPSLHVVNPRNSRLAEDVYAAPARDGLWWFWWPWAERIAADDDLPSAAALIVKVLGTKDRAHG